MNKPGSSDKAIVPHESHRLSYIVTTSLAAAFNLLVVIVICFVVVPLIDNTFQQGLKNAREIRKCHELLKENNREIEEQYAIIKQIASQLEKMKKE